MVTKIDYLIRFPFGAEFNKNPKFLFIQSIYREIKTHTCLNDYKCESCNLKESCVYFDISGQQFSFFPAILVNMNYLEKTKFKRNEVLDVSLYLIGNSSIYVDFIDSYFSNCDSLNGIYFQKTRKGEVKYDEKERYDGRVNVVNPFSKEDKICEMLTYYNSQYDTDFVTDVDIKEVNVINSNDRRKYLINGKMFKLSGFIGLFHVKNCPEVLLEMGIGSNNIIGGGKSIKCE